MKYIKITSLLLLMATTIFWSCNNEDDGGGGTTGPTVTSITVTASSTTVSVGSTVIFNTLSNAGQILTSNSTFYVDGVQINSNNYTFNELGAHTLKATYSNLESNTLTINVVESANAYVHRLLIEDYTGAWCGWCPRVSSAIQSLADQNIVPVAIHRGTSSGGNYDPFNFPAEALEAYIGLQGYPTAMLNRRTVWNAVSGDAMSLSQVTNAISSTGKPVGLYISSTKSGTNVSMTVKVGFAETMTNTKLVVYLLEDGLIQAQVNYTSNFGGVNPIPNFVHNDVLRASVTDLFGLALSGSNQGSTLTYTFAHNLSNASNMDNTKVVAFVIDSNGFAINSQEAAVGTTQDFETL